MTAHVVLLRQVNVGGRNKVPMARLREALRSEGFADAATYLANGNIVLTAGATPDEVAEDVRGCILDAFGKDVVVLVRTATEVADVLAVNPFGSFGGDDDVLHVGFFEHPPDADDVMGLKMLVDDGFGDLGLEVVGTELYLRYAEGAGGSRISPSALERAVGVRVALRSCRTVASLAEMAARL